MRSAGRIEILGIILSTVLAIVGLVSGLFGIYISITDPGQARFVLGGMIAVIFFAVALCYMILSPVLLHNWRGVSMLRAIVDSGLVDVENREYKRNELPPSEVYEHAHREVVITGITARETFARHGEVLQRLINNGIRVFVLILHPDSQDIQAIRQSVPIDIRTEIKYTLSLIRERGLNTSPNFQIRFAQRRLPFTAVMIDGDISYRGSDSMPWGEAGAGNMSNLRAQDDGAQIRIQPATVSFVTQHKGIVFQFKKKPERSERSGAISGFEYFAADVRAQWQGGEEHPELLLPYV